MSNATIGRAVQKAGCLISVLASATTASAQGTFQNLGFEAATVVPIVGLYLEFTPAFPGWFGYCGRERQTFAVYNTYALDASTIGIIDRGYSFGQLGSVIEGNYTAVLMAGILNGPSDPEDTTLSQTSLVPVAAQSLWFKAQLAGGTPRDFLQVTLGGQKLSLVAMGGGTNYTLYAADIHSFAGQTAELDFTAIAQRPHIGVNYVFLDSIQFSNQTIPEPSVVGLWGLAAVLAIGRVTSKDRGLSR